MRRFLIGLAALAVIAVVAIVVLRLAFPLPDIAGRTPSVAIEADPATQLGQRMAEAVNEHPGKTGVLPLENGHDALASRLALIEAAERSIDAQYYIWHDDTSGMLLFDALLRAAERGVRVRLLLDDNGVPGLDTIMATLDARDNFEIRLFNPSTVRSPKFLGYLFDFRRMNRRMHNKALIVDGAATIIGGRNIGDEYFRVGEDVFFIDMDVFASGSIVAKTAEAFDAYWNSASVHAVDTIIDGKPDIDAFRARIDEVKASETAAELARDMQTSADRFAEGRAALEWTDVQLVVDDPVKGEGSAEPAQLMISRLGEILGEIQRELVLVSAYFVPGRQGTDYFEALAEKGLDVRILTNALNATDVLMVHAGYTKYREELLRAGAKLYELKRHGGTVEKDGLQTNPFGLSGASLHAKTFAVDGDRVFIGSFNFDPRSALLNCEMGFLIHSPKMATQVSAAFRGPLEEVTYRPQLNAAGDIVWREKLDDGKDLVYEDEPGASWLKSAALTVIGLLPIEWLL